MSAPAALRDPELSAGTKPQQILEAAARVFMAEGYGAASMDQIARAAAVSKATLYAHFAGKDALFAAMLRHECAMLSGEPDEAELAGLALRPTLIRIGTHLLELVLSPKAVAVYRIVVAESARFPELGATFFSTGPATKRRHIAALIERAQARGELDCDDAERAADALIGLLLTPLHLCAVLGIGTVPDAAGRAQAAARAADTFLAAFAAPPA